MVKIVKISREEAARRLGDVADDKRFWCHDGRNIGNLRELRKALIDMSDETFHYHLGEGRNDFSNWVKEVVGDQRLGNELRKVRSRIQANKAVTARISFLESKL